MTSSPVGSRRRSTWRSWLDQGENMIGAKVLEEHTYVDDIINSKESEQDCMKDAVQIEKILARGSMGLKSILFHKSAK
jgi:hypothetical protein